MGWDWKPEEKLLKKEERDQRGRRAEHLLGWLCEPHGRKGPRNRSAAGTHEKAPCHPFGPGFRRMSSFTQKGIGRPL